MTATVSKVGDEQELPAFEDRVLGYVDTKADLDNVVELLEATGYSEHQITILFGAEGIEMIGNKQDHFYFADGEEESMELSLRHLKAGHYLLAIQVHDRDDAQKAVKLAQSAGAYSFIYFGKLMNERLT